MPPTRRLNSFYCFTFVMGFICLYQSEDLTRRLFAATVNENPSTQLTFASSTIQINKTGDDSGNFSISLLSSKQDKEIKLTTMQEIDATQQEECELPSCEIVSKSRLYSERCHNSTQVNRWPLLVTGTPRSATTYMSELLKKHGLKIQDDWHWELKHGRVSWIFAFEDKKPVYFRRGWHKGKGKYGRVLHQIKDPIKSITSICSEPVTKEDYSGFLKKHGNMSSLYKKDNDPIMKGRVVLQFWVEWHRFLKEMKVPTYQVEHVAAMHVAQMAGLETFYNDSIKEDVKKDHNRRGHRRTFTWQQLYTIDPEYAAEAWQLSHYYNYSYPDVDFDSLTCLDYIPDCNAKISTKNNVGRCPPGTHPFPKDGKKIKLYTKPSATSGIDGWVDDGCVERKLDDGTFVGEIGTKPLRR